MTFEAQQFLWGQTAKPFCSASLSLELGEPDPAPAPYDPEADDPLDSTRFFLLYPNTDLAALRAAVEAEYGPDQKMVLLYGDRGRFLEVHGVRSERVQLYARVPQLMQSWDKTGEPQFFTEGRQVVKDTAEEDKSREKQKNSAWAIVVICFMFFGFKGGLIALGICSLIL
jgi:hypothetical protein